ncbi:unnamed protein product [Lampetra fluviatilis]
MGHLEQQRQSRVETRATGADAATSEAKCQQQLREGVLVEPAERASWSQPRSRRAPKTQAKWRKATCREMPA